MMSNKYHLYMNDVPRVVRHIDVPDPTEPYFSSFSNDELSEEFLEWLHSRELFLTDTMPVQYFYVPPHNGVSIHSDQHEINDCTKINWLVGGEGSMMRWFEFKPGKTFNNKAQVAAYCEAKKNGEVLPDRLYVSGRADYEDVIMTHTAHLGNPSIVNVGRLHDFVSGPEASHIFCVVMFDLRTGKRVSWKDVPYFFADCIKK